MTRMTTTQQRAQDARREAARAVEYGQMTRHELGGAVRAQVAPHRSIGERVLVLVLKGVNGALSRLNRQLRRWTR
jgi:hypothetical protein